MGEELDAQVLQHALADPADEVGLRVGRAPVDERGDDEGDDDEVERAECRRARCRRRSRAWPAAAGRATRRCPATQRDEHQERAPAVGAQQLEQAAQLAPAPAGRAPAADEVVAPGGGALTAHRPPRSIGLRVRNTWSGRPFAAISAYSGERSSSSACVPRAAIAAVLEHDDLVGERDRREPVGDHERRAPGHHLAQRGLDRLLGRGVDRRGRVVEDRGSAGRPAARGRSRSAGAGRPRASARARRCACRSRRAARR